MKYDLRKGVIEQYSKVKLISVSGDCCLVEDMHTNERAWVQNYEIYPFEKHNYGVWKYDPKMQALF